MVQPEVNNANGSSMQCPMCGSAVPPEAVECPSCSEPLSPEAFEVRGQMSKKSKLLFYSGVLLVLIGGPGVALGSWLHDILKIPIGTYDSWEWGWVNSLVAAVGIVILVIGIILLILSLPRSEPDRKAKDKRSTTTEEKE